MKKQAGIRANFNPTHSSVCGDKNQDAKNYLEVTDYTKFMRRVAALTSPDIV